MEAFTIQLGSDRVFKSLIMMANWTPFFSCQGSGGASSSSLSSFAKQLEDNIIVKSMIEALNNCGEVSPSLST